MKDPADSVERKKLLVLNILRDRGPLSRAEVARAGGLSAATAKRLVDRLVSDGLLREAEAGERSGRGRRPALLRLDGRHGCSVGVSVEPHGLELCVADFAGESLCSRRIVPPGMDRPGLERVIDTEIRGAVESCAAAGYGPLVGIGAGIAGLVNAREGIVLYCPGLEGWENADLAGLLRRAAPGAQVVVDDVVRCMALAEKRHGSARELDTFLFVYIGSGVGAGIILDNRMYRGTHGLSGEFGHITIRENGPLCRCGNRGCLEALVSGPAVLARARAALSANVYSTLSSVEAEERLLALTDIRAAAVAGDKLANMIVAEIEDSIGAGIASLINILDPGTVVLSGEVISSFHGLILDGIRRVVGRRAMHAIACRTAICEGSLGASCAAVGAAAMVIERALRSEILNL